MAVKKIARQHCAAALTARGSCNYCWTRGTFREVDVFVTTIK